MALLPDGSGGAEMTDIPEKLLLRRDLRFTLLNSGPQPLFVIEDPIRQKFFRIGRPEYLFFTHLDGRFSLAEAVARTNSQLQEGFFTAENLPAVISWLYGNQLLSSSNEDQIKTLQDKHERERRHKGFSRLNLISIKIPLFNPDRLLQRIFPILKWLTGPLFFSAWLAILLAAVLSLSPNWSQFLGQATSALSPGNLIFLWLAWVLLKIWHELFHALVCYRYGGKVNEAGVLFILFIPLTYVNATSSWGFVSRWQRIYAAAAGIYAEVFIAAAATLVWAGDMHSISGAIAHNIILVAGFSSLVFNANPLMRFDGYFILSDLIDIPNLYERGRQFVSSLFSRLFYGEWTYVQFYTGGREVFLRLYGIASWIWRILITVSLTLMASQMFHGIGLVVALVSGILWLGIPLYRMMQKLRHIRSNAPHQFRYFCWTAPIATVLGLSFLLLFSWSENLEVPAVVEYQRPIIVKAASPGFIQTMSIHSGMQVQEGDLLARLENPELRAELRQTSLQIAAIETEGRIRLHSDNISEYQALKEKLAALKEQESALAKEVGQLEIRASGAGTVVGERLDTLPGVYLQKGTEICWLVDEGKKILHTSAAQDDIEGFRGREGQRVLVEMPLSGQEAFFGKIMTVAPQARQAIEQPAFSTTNGGPVAVRAADLKQDAEQDEIRGYEFFFPRFKVEIEIPPERAGHIRAGQRAVVETEGRALTLAFLAEKYLSRKLAQGSSSGQ